MDRLGIVSEAHQEATVTSWIRGIVFNDLPAHEDVLDLAWFDHPLGMRHLADCMGQKENLSSSCFPHSGQDSRLLHQEYSTNIRLPPALVPSWRRGRLWQARDEGGGTAYQMSKAPSLLAAFLAKMLRPGPAVRLELIVALRYRVGGCVLPTGGFLWPNTLRGRAPRLQVSQENSRHVRLLD